jgi:hypothetical protein
MATQNLLSLGEHTLSAVPRRSCPGREHKLLAASDKGPSCLFPVLPGAHPPDVEAQAPPLLLWRLVVGPGQVDGRAVDQRKLLQGFHVLAAGTQHGTQEPAIHGSHFFAEVCLCPRHDLLLGPDQRRGCAARAEAPGATRMEDKH